MLLIELLCYSNLFGSNEYRRNKMLLAVFSVSCTFCLIQIEPCGLCPTLFMSFPSFPVLLGLKHCPTSDGLAVCGRVKDTQFRFYFRVPSKFISGPKASVIHLPLHLTLFPPTSQTLGRGSDPHVLLLVIRSELL